MPTHEEMKKMVHESMIAVHDLLSKAPGWRDCVDCGGAFWDSDETRTTCCDRKLTLDDRGRIVWTTK